MASFCVHVFALALLASFLKSVHCLYPPNKPVLFVFGDSLYDAGNNNYINTTNFFKANFRPYGETYFPVCPTGRFGNGRLIPDYIANFAGKPFVQPYLEIKNRLNGLFINGVNFASAGAGSLDATNAGLVISFKAQLGYFKEVSQQLTQQEGSDNSKRLISKAVYMFSIGSNDYSAFITNSTLLNSYTPNQYVDMVVGNMSTVFQEIYKEGGRKFVILSVGTIGCVPSARAVSSGECVEILQTLAKLHNEALQKMLNNLATNLPGFKYSYFDYFQSSIDTISNPSKYGFTEVKVACCGSGPFRGDPSCGGKRGMTFYELCSDVLNYLFFDFAHPTEKANFLSATQMWETSPYVKPNNVKSFFQS
ncbi:PREDICTED: GDSL esterase/lipase 1-like [Ipomoea nil]|uniref:GDSL esterase/lipase 1-like n=1 Tax=Ipomoea nil TaxID=35883 RepID=UPI000901A150|nr:PREDICTED: GDSL esterase/lipase 1-like [Ipomoea nil]